MFGGHWELLKAANPFPLHNQIILSPLERRRNKKEKLVVLLLLFMKHFPLLFVFCTLSIVIAGCGPALPDGMPKLYPTTLTFTQEGKPLAEASVVLIPQFDCPWMVGGLTDANGQVPLKTHGKYDGAPAGKFKICVTKTVSEGELPSMDSSQARVAMTFYEAVELQYSKAETTPLEIDIEPKQTEEKTFDVGKAVKLKQAPPPM